MMRVAALGLLGILLLVACGGQPLAPLTSKTATETAPTTEPALAKAATATHAPGDTPAAKVPAASAATQELLAPNANLLAEGIPPIPLALVQQARRYADFRGHRFVEWHPNRREMIVSHLRSGASTEQLFRVAGPLAPPEQLTDAPEPVRAASYEPRHGRYLVFARANGGDEANQLYRLDLATKATQLLTNPEQRHQMQGWLHRSSRMLVMSVALDRTAQGGSRSQISQTLSLLDPARPESIRAVAELPGGGWAAGAVAWDDSQVALSRYISATESQVWLLALASGKLVQLLPAPGGSASASYYAGDFRRDNSGLYVFSDRDGEFRELMLYRFATAVLTPLTRHIPWDIMAGSSTGDGRIYAVQANVGGRDELRLFDGNSFRELPLPDMPPGSVVNSQFHHRIGELAFAINGAQGPSQVHSYDPARRKLTQWTRAEVPPGIDPSRFSDPQIVHWKSFDGRSISGLMSLPPASFAGKRPVLIQIHGGPASQSKIGFRGRFNYFVDELGVALIEPNVRGSSGFGKSFLALDDGRLREDAVKDIGALLDWIATQAHLDASRVVVSGGSYGGYMSLAVSVRYADRIVGAIDVVGISNFVSFLQNTESYRRDLRRTEYGDERDPAMRAFLESISPLNHAHRITKPLLVVQGRNDPRVPYTEAEQIVARLRDNGTPVWYLRAENEGHGFARRENADFYFFTKVMFLQSTLLK